MGPGRHTWIAAALGIAITAGCAPRGFDLPRTDAGQPLPTDAIELSMIDLPKSVALVAYDPRADTEPRRTELARGDDLRERLRALVFREVVAATQRRPSTEGMTLVVGLDHLAYLPGMLDVLVDPARTAATDPPLRVLLAVGDVEAPRGLPVPERLDVVGWEHLQTTWSLWVDDTMESPNTFICTRPDRHSELDPVPCTPLEDPLRPLHERHYPDDVEAAPTPAFVQRLCDHLGEPFDLHWSGTYVEELVTRLAHDPRPPRCRGKTWITRGLRHGDEWVTIDGIEAWRASRPIASW